MWCTNHTAHLRKEVTWRNPHLVVAGRRAGGAELLTGTFYLLMLAVGWAAAGLGSPLGASITLQIVTAAWWAAARWWAGTCCGASAPARLGRADRSVNLDVGETVMIDSWKPTAPPRQIPRRQLDRHPPPRRHALHGHAPRGRTGGQPPAGRSALVTPTPFHIATEKHPHGNRHRPFVIAVIFIARSVKVVPQQNAWVKERLGKYTARSPRA
jgi:hypothetical protein